MTYEDKIILNKLIDAISAPSEFDYVTLSVSITSALLSFCVSVLLGYVTYKLGKRQNQIAEQQTELQKRQYQIEKFNNYKDLHRDIYKCKCFLEAIFPKVYEYYIATDREVQKNSIDDYFTKLTELLFSIQNGVSDAMLRGDKQLDVQAVLDLVGSVGHLLIGATQKAPVGMNSWDWVTTIIRSGEFRENLTMDEQVECLFSLSKDPNLKAGMELFVKQYKAVFEGENNILAQLQILYNE